jgi:hypothetical protein
VRIMDCKVDVAEPRTWGLEMSLLLWPQRGDEHCRGAR